MNNNNKLLIAAVVVSSVLFVGVLSSKYLIHAITQNVIQELKRDYTPGPYDPGFDPDKVNPNIQGSKTVLPEGITVWEGKPNKEDQLEGIKGPK